MDGENIENTGANNTEGVVTPEEMRMRGACADIMKQEEPSDELINKVSKRTGQRPEEIRLRSKGLWPRVKSKWLVFALMAASFAPIAKIGHEYHGGEHAEEATFSELQEKERGEDPHTHEEQRDMATELEKMFADTISGSNPPPEASEQI